MAAAPAPSPTAPASPAATARPTSPGNQPRHRGKKANDPFLTRSLTAEVGKQFSQPSPGQADDHADPDAPHSLLADLIVTPLTMISFIFSLVLIDRQQRRWRLSQHDPDPASAGWSRAWLDPEPYQASAGPGRANERPASSDRGSAVAYSGWYTRKKKRAMARLEISDAFEMRKRVLVALIVWSALALGGALYLLGCTYAWIRGV